MGLLKNIERIALDIVEVEAQVIPAIVASALTGGVGGAFVTGLTVGTQAILSKIDAKSFEGEGLSREQLDAVNISRVVQGLTPVDQFGRPLRGFVEIIVRARIATLLPRRPQPGFVARERFAARAREARRSATVSRLEALGRAERRVESPQITQSLTDVPVTPRQFPIALPVGVVNGMAAPTLLVSRKEQKSGQLFRPIRGGRRRGSPRFPARRTAGGFARGSTVVC